MGHLQSLAAVIFLFGGSSLHSSPPHWGLQQALDTQLWSEHHMPGLVQEAVHSVKPTKTEV